jgi:hypothetical protein
LINFDDGRKLWSSITYFAEASDKDKHLRTRIIKIIRNGRFRKTNLVGIVQETSKEIVDLFYAMKKEPHREIQQESYREEDREQEDKETPFITANYHSKSEAQPEGEMEGNSL